jgi:hypothetical protein
MDGFEEWSLPDRPENVPRLMEEVQRLQEQVVFLEGQGAASLDVATFHHLTGFRDCAQAREEFERAGGDTVFGCVDRHKTFLHPEAVNKAYEQVQQQFPEHPEGLERALHIVGASRAFGPEEKQRTGSHMTVDEFHLFLLVFMYVHGGVQQFMAPFLPGVKVSQGHFSRLLVNSTPVVARTWANKYYCVRPLQWLVDHANPAVKTHTREEKKHLLDQDLQRADVVLCLDGYSVACEKSDGTSEQKQNYDYKKSSQPLMRIIEVCTLNGVVVQVSSATGGRTCEVEVALGLRLVDRIEEEAQQSGRHVRLHLVLDRGFFDYKKDLVARRWSHVTVTFSIPYHLITPGKKSAAELAAGLRKQHPAEEVEWNRTVASERWINEVSVGGINHARFLHRLLDLTTMHLIDDYLAIAAAQVNLRLKVSPV